MGAKLGERVYVGLDTILDPDFPELITVAADAGFSIRNTFITHGVAYLPDEQGGRPRRLEYVAPIKVGARTWIGGGCVILPGVTIGEDVIIGGGAVVMDDIPDRVMAAGNPARVIKERVLP
ncbi:MAG: DapH/DapD/GlmU-related protein [Chloroflexota bacterium]